MISADKFLTMCADSLLPDGSRDHVVELRIDDAIAAAVMGPGAATAVVTVSTRLFPYASLSDLERVLEAVYRPNGWRCEIDRDGDGHFVKLVAR